MNKPVIFSRNIIARSVLMLGVVVFVGAAIMVRDQTPGITFATQGIDLKIDNRAWYNGLPVPGSTWSLKNLIPTSDRFFKFKDIKPGDSGKTVISMHVGKADSWLCLDFSNLKSNENGVNEPESIVEPGGTGGELAKGTEFFSWIDNGDGVYKIGEKVLFGNGTGEKASTVLADKTYTVGDAGSGGSCKVDQSRYVGIAWCAGDLKISSSTGAFSCDGSVLGNAAQTDSFTVDMAIRALPTKENAKFLCATGKNPPPKDDHNDKPKDDKPKGGSNDKDDKKDTHR